MRLAFSAAAYAIALGAVSSTPTRNTTHYGVLTFLAGACG